MAYQTLKGLSLLAGISTSAYTAFIQRQQLKTTLAQYDQSKLNRWSRKKLSCLNRYATSLEQFKGCCCQAIGVVLPLDLSSEDKARLRSLIEPREKLALRLVEAYDNFSNELPSLAPGVLISDMVVDNVWRKFRQFLDKLRNHELLEEVNMIAKFLLERFDEDFPTVTRDEQFYVYSSASDSEMGKKWLNWVGINRMHGYSERTGEICFGNLMSIREKEAYLFDKQYGAYYTDVSKKVREQCETVATAWTINCISDKASTAAIRVGDPLNFSNAKGELLYNYRGRGRVFDTDKNRDQRSNRTTFYVDHKMKR